MTFKDLTDRAKSEWEALQSGTHILVGTATCGRAAGAMETVKAFAEELKRRNIEVKVIEVGCMGLCYAEPLVTISRPESLRVVYHHMTQELVPRLVEGYIINDDPCLELALGTFEMGDEGEAPYIPELPRFEKNIHHYLANDGYRGLEKALKMRPEEIIEEIKKSGLRGRGGAGFPTGLKWEICHSYSATPKYIVCNADEGDPGAFMDRIVLESDPQQVIEGMIIGGYAIGADEGYIYIRAEYPLAVERVKIALQQAEELGFLGNNILSSGFSFHINVAAGAGAFVSGEETGLMAAIEGEKSEPSPRPPYPAESGLWGKPTALNNVKTFANIHLIVDRGADWFASIGTEKSKGTALFSLAGKIKNSGLTEVPMGTTIREIVYGIGDGILNDREFKAVQLGGPSGGMIPANLQDTPIDFDSLTSIGSMMGSGGFVVMDEDDCAVDATCFFVDFITKESCGKCTPCRVGNLQMLKVLQNITNGKGTMADIDFLLKLAEDIKGGSLCALGGTAPNPVLTSIRYFRDEYEAHILEKHCPAKVCTNLTAYFILQDKCDRSCEHCVLTCPTEAIGGGMGKIKHIDQEKCVNCGTCRDVCPPEYDAVVKLSPISLLPLEDSAAKEKAVAKAIEESEI